MKRTFKLFLVALVVTLTASRAMGVDVVTPKLEMRSAWVATVWALDWPSSMGSSMEAQKADMTKLLDSLAVNNFNAVNFQVRGMSDAMYKSSLREEIARHKAGIGIAVGNNHHLRWTGRRR